MTRILALKFEFVSKYKRRHFKISVEMGAYGKASAQYSSVGVLMTNTLRGEATPDHKSIHTINIIVAHTGSIWISDLGL